MRQRNKTEVFGARVSSAGAVSAATAPCLVQRTGTGTYTVIIPGFKIIAAQVSGITGAAAAGLAQVTSDTTCAIVMFTPSTGAAADLAFNFTAVGQVS